MKLSTLFVVPLFLLLASSCEDAISSDSDETSQTFNAKMAGPWVPPTNLVQQSLAFDMTYVGAGPWVGDAGCGGSFSEGAKFVKNWVQGNFGYVTLVGGYNCRPINGNPNQMSVHATGRAIDIHIPLDGDQADNDLGDPIANYLLEHADKMGVQLIIWDRWIWSVGRTGAQRSRAYGGAHPHHDHIHMELTPDASMKMAPWFTDPNPVMGFECEEKIEGEGGTIDNKSSCFQMFGKQEFWRTEPGGYNGELRWTNAFKTNAPSNWARWMANFNEGGKYKVFFYSVPEFAVFDSTRYIVKHDGKSEEIFIDQSASTEEGWQEIGTYTFAQGADQWVAVHDDSPLDVADDQHVIADAIRLERIDGPMNNHGTNNSNTNNDPNNQTNGQNNATNGMSNNTGGTNNSEDDILVDEGCSSINALPNPLFLFLGFFFFFKRRKD